MIGDDLGIPWSDGIRASAFDVWKTISLGSPRNVYDLRETLARRRMWVGNLAKEALTSPNFRISKTPTDVQLTIVTTSELGFKSRGATFLEVHGRAIQLGLSLSPAEVGPQLRLQHREQPIGEFLLVAMEPVVTLAGEAVSFVVGNGGAGLIIVGRRSNPDDIVSPPVRLVFVVPR
jgi:hypothetical protein